MKWKWRKPNPDYQGAQDCLRCKKVGSIRIAPYPLEKQARAGWVVWICVSCDRTWVD